MRIILTIAALFVLALAQLTVGTPPITQAQAATTPTPSPYNDLFNTEIRGISPETIDAYRTGAGNGIALPAELNGYPGPRHVLALAEELELTDEQYDQVKSLYDEMLPQAIALGEQILVEEAAIEIAFRDNIMDEAFLEEQLAEIGALQAELRFVHLSTHIATTGILTLEQIAQYNELRGYTSQNTHQGHNGS